MTGAVSADEPDAAVPAATIVITNYNYDRFLAEAVASAVDQTVRCQVIVVDDGSTDRSAAVLDRLVEQYPELTVIKNTNGGQASAMNAGWAKSTAPYLLFLDADDRLAPDAVATVVARFQRRPEVDRCLFRLRWVDADGGVIPGGFPDPGQPLPDGDLRARMVRNPDDIPWQPTSGNAFRCSALARFMPIPESPYRISADHYLSNLSALTGPVSAIEAELGDYRVHGANADHRPGFDLVRAREILVRTEETRQRLIEHGRSIGLTMPATTDGFLSLTNAAMRLASQRAGAAGGGHPFPGDRRLRLAATGLRAAMARRDLPFRRRILAMAWIVSLAIVPRAAVVAVAGRGLTR